MDTMQYVMASDGWCAVGEKSVWPTACLPQSLDRDNFRENCHAAKDRRVFEQGDDLKKRRSK